MLTAYIIACIMITTGIISISIGRKSSQKSEMYDPCGWYFVGAVLVIVGSIIGSIQLMMV